jgi:hypothetical protein
VEQMGRAGQDERLGLRGSAPYEDLKLKAGK